MFGKRCKKIKIFGDTTMAKWTKTQDGYRHIASGAVVEKGTSGNPHRNGDWFLTVLPKAAS